MTHSDLIWVGIKLMGLWWCLLAIAELPGAIGSGWVYLQNGFPSSGEDNPVMNDMMVMYMSKGIDSVLSFIGYITIGVYLTFFGKRLHSLLTRPAQVE